MVRPLPASTYFKPAEANDPGRPKRRETDHPADARPRNITTRRHVLAENTAQNRVSTLYMSPTTPGSPYLQQSEMQSPSQAPVRFGNIAQSIELPTQVKPVETNPDRVIYSMPSSHGYPPEDRETEDRRTYRSVQQNLHENPQVTKRRRLEAVDAQFLERRTGPHGLQETVLIPIGHADNYGSTVRRIDEPESFRPPRSQEARPLQRIVYLDQRDAPVFQHGPSESDRGVSYSIDSPSHRQFLVSSQQPPFHSFSAIVPVEILSTRLHTEIPRHGSLQNASYGTSTPYVSLPREAPRASNIDASGSERGAVQSSVVGGGLQLSLGESPRSKGQRVQQESSSHGRQGIRAEQPERYNLPRPPTVVHVDRPRRYLPLERSFEELRPVLESTSASNFTEPGHRASYTQEPIYIESPKAIPGTRPLHRQEESSPCRATDVCTAARNTRAIHDISRYRPSVGFGLCLAKGRMKLMLQQIPGSPMLNTHPGHQPRPIRGENMYSPVIRVPSYGREPQRVFDKHTGRELIVLE